MPGYEKKRRNTKSHSGHVTKFHITTLIIEIRKLLSEVQYMLIEGNGVLGYGEIRINYLKVCQDEACSTSVTPLQQLVCLLFLLGTHLNRITYLP